MSESLNSSSAREALNAVQYVTCNSAQRSQSHLTLN